MHAGGLKRPTKGQATSQLRGPDVYIGSRCLPPLPRCPSHLGMPTPWRIPWKLTQQVKFVGNLEIRDVRDAPPPVRNSRRNQGPQAPMWEGLLLADCRSASEFKISGHMFANQKRFVILCQNECCDLLAEKNYLLRSTSKLTAKFVS